MYIGKHSIFCLRAFMDGWYFRNPNEDVQMQLLNDFTLWLQNSFFNGKEYSCLGVNSYIGCPTTMKTRL